MAYWAGVGVAARAAARAAARVVRRVVAARPPARAVAAAGSAACSAQRDAAGPPARVPVAAAGRQRAAGACSVEAVRQDGQVSAAVRPVRLDPATRAGHVRPAGPGGGRGVQVGDRAAWGRPRGAARVPVRVPVRDLERTRDAARRGVGAWVEPWVGWCVVRRGRPGWVRRRVGRTRRVARPHRVAGARRARGVHGPVRRARVCGTRRRRRGRRRAVRRGHRARLADCCVPGSRDRCSGACRPGRWRVGRRLGIAAARLVAGRGGTSWRGSGGSGSAAVRAGCTAPVAALAPPAPGRAPRGVQVGARGGRCCASAGRPGGRRAVGRLTRAAIRVATRPAAGCPPPRRHGTIRPSRRAR